MILIPALFGYGQTAVFSALRVFAISNRNLVLSLLVFILVVAPIMTNSYVVAKHGVVLPFIGPQLVICAAKMPIPNPAVLASKPDDLYRTEQASDVRPQLHCVAAYQ
ncbi:hypothetical protein PsYK624_077710 [Phanerochaete sordida]|uniref:Uncharacterized protein n=1 Tax=Phanerochaete sordida TaxID=48140 RepID=A0A9P3GBA2_9APHY|nr:hypothetical protein PsYK624_077710 [Phanerochaete sordida]